MARVKKTQDAPIRADYLTRFQPKGEIPMAEKPLSVRLPSDLDAKVRALPNRTEWLRDAIIEKLQRESEQAAS